MNLQWESRGARKRRQHLLDGTRAFRRGKCVFILWNLLCYLKRVLPDCSETLRKFFSTVIIHVSPPYDVVNHQNKPSIVSDFRSRISTEDFRDTAGSYAAGCRRAGRR